MSDQPDPTPPPIDLSQLDKWAQEDAHNDNAKGAEREFPSFEGRIQHIVQTYAGTITKDFIAGFQSRTGSLRDDFTDLAGRIVGDPKTHVQETINHVNTAISTAEKQCAPKITDLQRELAEWEVRFKSGFQNGISNPKKQNAIWHWGVVLFLLAVEVILNSRFFAETSEYGLLGGTMAAVTVSVVNVGLPILVGYFTHKLYFGKGAIQRGVGVLLAILLVIFAASFNYEVAEYRNRLLLDAGKPPSSLPEYFALLAIGGAIAVISFWKMFSYMDPFLRPRRCHRNREDAIGEYEDIALKALRDAQQRVKDTIKDVAIRVDRVQDVVQNEKVNFEFKCSEAVRECGEHIGYYHLKYCPVKVDPDPEMPVLESEQYHFAPAQNLVNNTLKSLEDNCRRAKEEWQPILEETRQSLVSTHQKYQAVVVANIQAAIAKAN